MRQECMMVQLWFCQTFVVGLSIILSAKCSHVQQSMARCMLASVMLCESLLL
jgi:hypothetical protein